MRWKEALWGTDLAKRGKGRWRELGLAGKARPAYLVFGRPAAHNGLELSCPAEAGNSPLIYGLMAGGATCTQSPARRVSFSELLGGPEGRSALGVSRHKLAWGRIWMALWGMLHMRFVVISPLPVPVAWLRCSSCGWSWPYRPVCP
jgi:hypothetical protein